MNKGDLVTLSNGKEYIVIKTMILNGNDYVFLVTKDGISEVKICIVQNDSLKVIRNDENTISILLERFKEELV